MVKTQYKGKTIKFEGWFLLSGAALILGFLFFKLYGELKPQLERTQLALKEGRAIKLQSVIDRDALKRILANGGYYTDEKDVNLLADSLSRKLFETGELDNLGSLNKSSFAITAPVPWKTNTGGIDFQDRLRASRQLLGFDSALYNRELTNPVAYPAKRQVSTGNLEMKGRVLSGGRPMNGVLVQLREHIGVEEEDEDPDADSIPAPIAWARTDVNGEFTFTGLNKDSGYSILPMKPGFEFGSRQGTRQLSKNVSYTFSAKPHKVRLIGSVAYSQLKQDGLIIVRTPEEFTTSFQLIAGGLIFSFFFCAPHPIP